MQIRDVPELVCLLRQGLDKVRMGVAERGDRDAGGEVEIAVAFSREEVDALPALEGKIAAGIGRKQGRFRHGR